MASARSVALLVAIMVMFAAPFPAHSEGPKKEIFLAEGRSIHWKIRALFSPAEWLVRGSVPQVGYEFSPDVTYAGPSQRIYWYRIEPLFPRKLTIRARPNPPTKRGDCVVDMEFTSPEGEGGIFPPGKTYSHGNCNVYPWHGGGRELATIVSKGLYVVAWEDDMGVHSEPVPLDHIRFEQ